MRLARSSEPAVSAWVTKRFWLPSSIASEDCRGPRAADDEKPSSFCASNSLSDCGFEILKASRSLIFIGSALYISQERAVCRIVSERDATWASSSLRPLRAVTGYPGPGGGACSPLECV